MRIACIIAALGLAGCATTVPVDVGCTVYGESRADMPRPLGSGDLAGWVAVLDSRMTAACR